MFDTTNQQTEPNNKTGLNVYKKKKKKNFKSSRIYVCAP